MNGPKNRPRLPAPDIAPIVSPCVCTVPHRDASVFSVGVVRLFPTDINAITPSKTGSAAPHGSSARLTTIATAPANASFASFPFFAIRRINPP